MHNRQFHGNNSGGTDMATVTTTIEGTPSEPGNISGFVYADVDHDGEKDRGERATWRYNARSPMCSVKRLPARWSPIP